MNKDRKLNIFFVTALLILIVILFFPLIAGHASMKWDAVDLDLTWKNFICNALKNGFLPLWNPSINGGFPQMGDPGTWYPVSWLVGLCTNGYDLYSVSIEYLLHLLIAGIGMYFLVLSKMEHKKIAFLIACAYMFSGVFIGNAQHFGWVVSGAWLPWIILYYRKWIKGSLPAALLLGLFLFLQLSGGYPGMFFVTVYLLIFIFLWDAVKIVLKKQALSDLHPFRQIFIFLITFLCLSMIVIHSSFEMSNYINRGNPLANVARSGGFLQGSLTFRSLVSIFTPFATAKNPQLFWGFDVSMINSYIGGIIIVIILSQVFGKKNKNVRAFFMAAIFFFLCALGKDLPVRTWISYLPLMDLFRFPSLFRLFADFFLLIAGAYALQNIFENHTAQKLFFQFLIGFIVIILAVLIPLIVQAQRWRFIDLLKHGFLHFFHTAGLTDFAVLQLLILFGLVGILIIIYCFKRKIFKHSVIIICLIELCSATWLNRYATVMSDKSLQFSSTGLEKAPLHYQIPPLIPMKDFSNSAYRSDFSYLWRNLPILMKVPAYSGYSPYLLLSQMQAHKLGYDSIMINHPFVFMCYDSLKNHKLNVQKSSADNIRITKFIPIKTSLIVDAKQSGYVILNQNYYPYWQGIIDEKHTKVLKFNKNYMAIKVPIGRHKITFVFNPPHIYFLWYLLWFGLIIIPIILIILKVKNKFH